MKVTWPSHSKQKFGSEMLQAEHTLHESPLFSDKSLAKFLDTYPRERLGIWRYGEHDDADAAIARGTAGDLTGAEILQAVKTGKMWLNTRDSNTLCPEYGPVADAIKNSMEQAFGTKILKADMAILISSPHVDVNYHLDIPYVGLFHIKGTKKFWLYPRTERFAPTACIEDIVRIVKEESLPYKPEFDAGGEMIRLQPGMGLNWPQAAPHRITNEDSMNVSLSYEFTTLSALLYSNAMYTNGFLRQHFGWSQQGVRNQSLGTIGKAAAARLIRVAAPKPTKSPVPVSFKIDPRVDDCVRPV